MTTRDGAPNEKPARVKRPEPQQDGPIRAAGGAGKASDEPTMSEAVAHAVRTGYDVIAENIREGREAAARFRQGEYNIREVPRDLEVVVLRLLHLARELSTTTFDVCERLVKELGPQPPPDGRKTTTPPPFRAPAPPATAPARTDPARMKLTLQFVGGAKAVSRTEWLDRPRRPTGPDDLAVSPLAKPNTRATISKVTFKIDMSLEGLVAEVTVPKGLEPGVYSGLVHAKNDEVPLGVLSVEIRK